MRKRVTHLHSYCFRQLLTFLIFYSREATSQVAGAIRNPPASRYPLWHSLHGYLAVLCASGTRFMSRFSQKIEDAGTDQMPRGSKTPYACFGVFDLKYCHNEYDQKSQQYKTTYLASICSGETNSKPVFAFHGIVPDCIIITFCTYI